MKNKKVKISKNWIKEISKIVGKNETEDSIRELLYDISSKGLSLIINIDNKGLDEEDRKALKKEIRSCLKNRILNGFKKFMSSPSSTR